MKTLVHKNNENCVEIPTGFSWTTLFFGFFPALIRGNVILALIQFAACMITFGASLLVFPFLVNGMHEKTLIKEGYIEEAKFNRLREEAQNKEKEEREFRMAMLAK